MKFTCDGCGKRYATADEPVPGRIYKLTCRRCGHVIVLRVPAAVVGPFSATPARAPAGPAPAPAAAPRDGPRAAAAASLPDLLPAAAPELELDGPAVVPTRPQITAGDRSILAAPAGLPPTVPAAAGTAAASATVRTEPAPSFEPALDDPARARDTTPPDGTRTPPPIPALRAVSTPPSVEPVVHAAPAAPPAAELPPLLPEEPDEPTVLAGPALPATAAEPPPAARRRFELSRMSGPRAGLPLPLLLIGLLIAVAVVVALVRVERPRPPPSRPAAAAPSR